MVQQCSSEEDGAFSSLAFASRGNPSQLVRIATSKKVKDQQTVLSNQEDENTTLISLSSRPVGHRDLLPCMYILQMIQSAREVVAG